MLFANDVHGKRIAAEDAVRENQYYCPGCKARLIVKQGKINIWHYAHEARKACDLVCENKMTQWHINHQSAWPPDEREVFLEHDGVSHIADVKHQDVIIEFQHSPIDYKTLVERSNFYHKYGVVVWVFDLIDKAERIEHHSPHWEKKCNIECGDEEDYLSHIKSWCSPCRYCHYNKGRRNNYYSWKRASKTLGLLNYKGLDAAGMKVFFQLSPDDIVHVKWSKEGVKLFSGDPMTLDKFHQYINELATQIRH